LVFIIWDKIFDKIYFETQNWKALDSFLESFRIYILRNKQLDERRRKSGRNLIKYTRKLIVIEEQKGSFSKQEIEENLKQLKHQISITELVMNKSWLLSKCEF